MKYINKLTVFLFLLLLPVLDSYGQGPYGYYNDALTFSRTQLGGTARTQGMGGVQIGLGGDVSNILSNPAGLGLFNRSEVSFSPSVRFQNSSTRYMGNNTDVFSSNFGFENIGIVLNRSRPVAAEGEWRGGSFGISYNRTNNLNTEFQYSASNPETSIVDYFLDAATGIPENQLSNMGLVGLAYESFLIDPIPDEPGQYETFIPYPNSQREVVRTIGSQSQWNLSYGGNYADKFYVGGGIGISSLRYRNEKVYREDFVNTDLVNLLINEDFRVNGIGVNATLGIIYRPNDLLRFGASVISPSIYSLSDESGALLSTLYNDEDAPTDMETPLIISSYTLKTPTRINGGTAFFFGKTGFISADVEYVNYRGNRFNARDFSMAEDNQEIISMYQPVVNVKLGGEYRINMLRFRAGAGYFSDPIADNDINMGRLNLSAGIGLRLPTFYVDLAILNDTFQTDYSPYSSTISGTPTADINYSNTRGILTVGFNF